MKIRNLLLIILASILCLALVACGSECAHNDANVLCMGARVIGAGLACDIADIFVNTEFEGGRHQTRIDMVMALENE